MSKLTPQEFVERFKNIKLLALDVDGVLTDDSIYFGPDGFELKKFNISDGLFMVLSMRAGLELAIVSGRHSAATDTRMNDLGVKHVLQAKLEKSKYDGKVLKGTQSKVTMIKPLLKELHISFKQVAFVGNEILDIKLAKECGLSIAVADSSKQLLDIVDFVTEKNGGQGAVREVLEYYFKAINKDANDYLI